MKSVGSVVLVYKSGKPERNFTVSVLTLINTMLIYVNVLNLCER